MEDGKETQLRFDEHESNCFVSNSKSMIGSDPGRPQVRGSAIRVPCLANAINQWKQRAMALVLQGWVKREGVLQLPTLMYDRFIIIIIMVYF